MDNTGDDQGPTLATGAGKRYALSGRIMLSAIVVLLAVVVFMVGLHLYARWYLVRLRRRQFERRRQRRPGWAHVILYADGRVTGDRGLELAVINSLPYFFYTSKPGQQRQPPLECAVCLSELEEKEIVRLLPKCDHIFHLDCIDMWFGSHSTCPLCRTVVEYVEEELVTAKLPDDDDGVDVLVQGTSCGACATCQREDGGETTTASLGGRGRGKGVGVRIEVPPPRRVDLEGEATSVSSPSGRLLYLKRILSMGKRSPATPSAPGPSRVPEEVDLESGPGEATRAQT